MARTSPRNKEEFSDSICEDVERSLRNISRSIRMQAYRSARKFGLTGPQLVLLKMIPRDAGISLGDLARETRLSQATVTGIVERMTRRGFITKRRSETDRRKVLVRRTPKANQLLGKPPTLLQYSFLRSFQQLPRWEQDMILSALHRLEDLMSSPGAEDRKERVPLC